MNKAEIMREYFDLHSESIKTEWLSDHTTEDELEHAYDEMLAGVYGDVRPVEGFDGEYEIEIPGSNTNSGNPKIFTFMKADK